MTGTTATQPVGSLRPGLERVDEMVVEGLALTDQAVIEGERLAQSERGDTPVQYMTGILSTPGMVALIERTAVLLAQQHLPADSVAVGFEVSMRHVGVALRGTTVSVRARLREVTAGRKLRFDVEVSQDGRTIGIGTHERRVIQVPPELA